MELNEKQLIGHDEQRAQLRQLLREGRLPHALLFSGPDGIVGKLPLPCAHTGSPAKPAAFQLCPGIGVGLAVMGALTLVLGLLLGWNEGS